MFGPSITFYEFLKIFVAGYYTLISSLMFIYLFVSDKIFSWNPNLQIAFFGFLGLIIGLILDSVDPLLRLKSLKECKFFRKQFPDKYLTEICNECDKESDCENSLKKIDSKPAWFYIYDNILSEYLRNFIFMVSALCRVVFYLKYISFIFFVLSFLYLLFYSVNYLLFFFWETSLIKISLSYSWQYKYYYLITYAFLFLVIKKSNCPDDSNPSGAWIKWRNVNRDLKYWIKINREIFIKVVCEQNISLSN